MNFEFLREAGRAAFDARYSTTVSLHEAGFRVDARRRDGERILTSSRFVGYAELAASRVNLLLAEIERVNADLAAA